jgi:hypothetical protein
MSAQSADELNQCGYIHAQPEWFHSREVRIVDEDQPWWEIKQSAK